VKLKAFYKEIILILGIVVAIIISVTTLAQQPKSTNAKINSIQAPKISGYQISVPLRKLSHKVLKIISTPTF
jgi:hypothetical protein